MSDTPYRSAVYIDRQAEIHEQMVGSVKMLVEWKRYKPIIAGGALWSWAAGNLANDIDIFAQSTMMSRWFARRRFGDSKQNMSTDQYGTMTTGKVVHVFKTHLRNHPSTPVDFVLSHRAPTSHGGIFDWAHCEVAYGLEWHCIEGAKAYRDGQLQKLHPDARSKMVVQGKLQTSLWLAQDAEDKLMAVMRKLAKISGNPLKDTRDFVSVF